MLISKSVADVVNAFDLLVRLLISLEGIAGLEIAIPALDYVNTILETAEEAISELGMSENTRHTMEVAEFLSKNGHFNQASKVVEACSITLMDKSGTTQYVQDLLTNFTERL